MRGLTPLLVPLALAATPDGSLRVAEYLGPEAEFPGARPAVGSWMVFDPVWGVYRDELDVERVRAYRRTEG